MKNRLEKIVKENEIVNKLYTFFGSLILSTASLFVRTDPNLILFVSFMGKSINDSPHIIYEELRKDKNNRCIWGVTSGYQISESVETVKIDSIKYFYYALKANVWITNVNIERGLKFKKKRTIYINTWHGIPLKYIGNDVKGRNDYNFSNIDMFLYTTEYEKEIYSRAFRVKCNSLYKLGMPRNYILSCSNNSDSKKISFEVKKKFNISSEKKIVLYAPTWREYEYDYMEVVKTLNDKLGDNYHLLYRLHHNTKGIANYGVNSSNVSDFEPLSDLLFAADLLVTDFSSILFDFAQLDKVPIIYADDYEKYKFSRGLYLELDEIGLPFYSKLDTLISSLIDDTVNDDANFELFTSTFEMEKGNNIKEIINYIYEKKESFNSYK